MRSVSTEDKNHPALIFWIAAGWFAFLVLPWYGIEDFWTFEWLVDGYPFDEDYAPAAFLLFQGEKLWLAPLLLPLLIALAAIGRKKSDPTYARTLILAGALGFGWQIAQGFGIGIRGFNFAWLAALFGDLGDRQYGMGYGALLVASAFLFLFTQGIAARGAINGDVFVVSAIGGVITIVTAFVFFLEKKKDCQERHPAQRRQVTQPLRHIKLTLPTTRLKVSVVAKETVTAYSAAATTK